MQSYLTPNPPSVKKPSKAKVGRPLPTLRPPTLIIQPQSFIPQNATSIFQNNQQPVLLRVPSASNGQILVKKEKKNAPKKLVAPKPFVPKTEPLSPAKAIKRENASPSKGNSPKRARSSYAFFISDQMKTEDGTDNRTKMTRANERWKELPADQKSVYERMAADDKVRYERELAAYKLQQSDDIDDLMEDLGIVVEGTSSKPPQTTPTKPKSPRKKGGVPGAPPPSPLRLPPRSLSPQGRRG